MDLARAGWRTAPAASGHGRARLHAPAGWPGRIFAAALLILSLPLLAVAAASVALLSRATPFIAHRRVGRHGEEFWMLKLRSMWDRSQPRPAAWQWIEYLPEAHVPVFKGSNDPRVTSPLARFYRRFSIDELPQLLHVITGRMRLVGPRPVTFAEWDRYYGDSAAEVDIDRLRDLASEAPVVRFVDRLIAGAVAEGASDIHIEPFEDRLRIRYRLDGRLQEVDALPPADRLAITSRLKIMAGLNIAERRQPQDGRIRTAVEGGTLDIRVATAPTLHGESLVLRLLHRDRAALELPKLGFDGLGLERLQRALDRPHGLVLVTGPTGSGKTTTLYAALSRLNSVDRKILTVEDPIEYQIPGVNQVQVNPKFGLTFAHVLRSFLRHDPDVIMVGEIRDAETAQIAVHAALTGHLVLATLHTNDAPSAVTRLIDMRVEDFLLTSTVAAIVGQRLVRTLCRYCRAPGDTAPADLARLASSALGGGRIHAPYRPVGCERCRGTGFSGRTTISEVMTMSDGLRRIILDHGESHAIRRLAVEEGMLAMLAHGVEKIAAGVTTLDEVLRATADA